MSGIPASTLNFSVNMLGVDVALQWMGQLKDAFGGAASAAVDTYAQTELLQLSYKALAAQEMMSLDPSLSKRDAMRQGADAARDLYEYTQRMAIQSPFTSEDIAQAAKIGMAYAFLATQVTDVEEAQQKNLMTTQRVVQAQLDFAAGTGNASSVIAELTSILGKAQATGTLLSEDFAMLSDHSVPIIELLAKHYGVTTQEIIRLRGESKITADEAIDAIVRWQEAIHGGAAEAMGGTMSGLQASMEELRGTLLREAATPLIEGTVQPAMQTMVDLMRRPEVLQAARDVGALSQELTEGLVPALQGATTAWIAYHAASNIGHIQALGGWSRAAAAGLNPLSAGLSSVGHGLSSVASRAAQVPRNLMTAGSAATAFGGVTAAVIYLNQELDRLAEHKATSTLEQTSGWQQAQEAIEQYKLASPEVQAELQNEKAVLDALMASMENRAIVDAQNATKNVQQSEAEKTRILINNYQYYADQVGAAAANLSNLVDAETEAVQIHDTRIAHLKDLVEMQEQVVDIQLSGLKAARDQERDQLQSQEDLVAQYWERRGAVNSTYWQAHASAQSTWDQALMDEFLVHHNNLSAAEQERLMQRGTWNQAMFAEDERYNQELATIEETRIDSRVDAQDTYRTRLVEIDADYARNVEAAEVQLTDTLADLAEQRAEMLVESAEQAADASTEAFTTVVEADVQFIRDSRDRREAWLEQQKNLAKQGAWCELPEMEQAAIEEEALAASKYAEQEALQREHLGRMLQDYAIAQAMMYGVSEESLTRMLNGIADAYGIVESIPEMAAARAMSDIDAWAQRGGSETDLVIAGFHQQRNEAVKLQLALEDLKVQKTEALAQQYMTGQMSEADYRTRLQQVDVEARQELGVDQRSETDSFVLDNLAAHQEQVEDAHATHQDTLADLETQREQDRLAAKQQFDQALVAADVAAQDAREQLAVDHSNRVLEIQRDLHTAWWDAFVTQKRDLTDLDEVWWVEENEKLRESLHQQVLMEQITQQERIFEAVRGAQSLLEVEEALALARMESQFFGTVADQYHAELERILSDSTLTLGERQSALDDLTRWRWTENQKWTGFEDKLTEVAAWREGAHQHLIEHPESDWAKHTVETPLHTVAPAIPEMSLPPGDVVVPPRAPVPQVPTSTPPTPHEATYGTRGQYTAQPVVNVTNHITIQNPVVDTPAWEQRLRSEMESTVRRVVSEDIVQVLKGGKNVKMPN